MINIYSIPILENNYVWILSNTSKSCIIIDPGEFFPVFKRIIQLNLKPIAILITHNHLDHILGIKELLLYFPKIKVFGSIESIKFGITDILFGGEKINLLGKICNVIYTPGHTIGHLSYYIYPYLFCGDTLFSGGCGNVQKENYIMMFLSLKKISNLPNNTIICCTHEYTKKNLEFLKLIFPNEKNIFDYYNQIKKLKYQKTLPSNLLTEKKINIFLRLTMNKNNKLEKNFFDYFVFIRKLKNKYK